MPKRFSSRLVLLGQVLFLSLVLGCAEAPAPQPEPAQQDAGGTAVTPIDGGSEVADGGNEVADGGTDVDGGSGDGDGGFLLTEGTYEPIQAFYVGHSLMSDIPDMVMSVLLEQQSDSFSFKEQNIPGSPLRWHWDNSAPNGSNPFTPGTSFEENVHVALASGDYSHVILTDSVPRGGTEMEDETVNYVGQMLVAARTARPDVRVYYYETWHHLTSGTANSSPYDTTSPTRHLPWRERLEADGAMWQSIVDRVNVAHPAGTGEHPVKLIPAGRMLGRLVDAIEAGQVDGFNAAEDLFSDDIHTNSYAKYFVGMIHASALTLRDPTLFTSDVSNRWGGSYWGTPHWDGNTYPAPSAAAVSTMQDVARDAIHQLYAP